VDDDVGGGKDVRHVLAKAEERDAPRQSRRRDRLLGQCRQGAVAHDPGHGVRPLGEDARERADEDERGLGRTQPLHEADDGARVGNSLRGPERTASRTVERGDRREVDARADDEGLPARDRGRGKHAERHALDEILLGHEHRRVAQLSREPLEPDEERPAPVHGVVE
jgi:hypothetical protein